MGTGSDTVPMKIQWGHPVGCKLVVHVNPVPAEQVCDQTGNNRGVFVYILFFAVSIVSMSVAFYLD